MAFMRGKLSFVSGTTALSASRSETQSFGDVATVLPHCPPFELMAKVPAHRDESLVIEGLAKQCRQYDRNASLFLFTAGTNARMAGVGRGAYNSREAFPPRRTGINHRAEHAVARPVRAGRYSSRSAADDMWTVR